MEEFFIPNMKFDDDKTNELKNNGRVFLMNDNFHLETYYMNENNFIISIISKVIYIRKVVETGNYEMGLSVYSELFFWSFFDYCNYIASMHGNFEKDKCQWFYKTLIETMTKIRNDFNLTNYFKDCFNSKVFQ
jgi:hypothetical protein